MNTWLKIGLLMTCWSAAACSATDTDGQSVDETSSGTASAEELLNRVSYQDLQLSFYWMGPGSIESQNGQIGLEETSRVDYVSALHKQYGGVTMLEIFKAFAPKGMEPNPALVAQHEAEARAHGRTGEALKPLDIDASSLTIDKFIPNGCDRNVFPDISPGGFVFKQQAVGADGQLIYLCVGPFGTPITQIDGGAVSQPSSDIGCSRMSNQYDLAVGLCNDTVSPNPTEFWTQSNTPLGRTTTKRANVNPGQFGRFTITRSLPPFVFDDMIGLGVISRNSAANVANLHLQLSAIGVYP